MHRRRRSTDRAAHEAAVPRRPRRQPAAAAASCSRRATTSRPATIDAAELRAVEDEAIREVVRNAGGGRPAVAPPTASSGARRGTWTSSTSSTASRKEAGHIAVKFHNADGDIEFTPAALHVDGKLGVSKTIFGDDFALPARRRSTTSVPKLTIPSPSMVHYRGGKAAIDAAVYPDLDAFWADLTAAYARGGAPARRARLHATCSSTTRASRT